MKGIFTDIKYRTTSAVGRDSKSVGCVVGLPIVAEKGLTIDKNGIVYEDYDSVLIQCLFPDANADGVADAALAGGVTFASIGIRLGDTIEVQCSYHGAPETIYAVLCKDKDADMAKVIFTRATFNIVELTDSYVVSYALNVGSSSYVSIQHMSRNETLEYSKPPYYKINPLTYEYLSVGDMVMFNYTTRWMVLRVKDIKGPITMEVVRGMDPRATTAGKLFTTYEDITAPMLKIPGDAITDNFMDGDVLHSLEIGMSAAGGDPVRPHPGATTITKTNYGTGSVVAAFSPIDVKFASEIGVVTYDHTTRLITVGSMSPAPAASPGDTILVTNEQDRIIYRFVATGEAYASGINTLIPVTPINLDYSLTEMFSLSGITVYYDYTGITTGTLTNVKSRGYALTADTIVYRTSEHGVKTISSVNDIIDAYGSKSLVNPYANLACGAYLYAAACGATRKFKTCALDLRGIASATLAENTPFELMATSALWGSAMLEIDKHRDIYYLATMTGDAPVQDVCIAYVNGASATARRREKLYYLPRRIVNMGLMDVGESGILTETFGNTLYYDSTYVAGNKYADGYVLPGEGGGTRMLFDKSADVEAALSYPMAYNNERLIFIGTEYATIDETNIEGYYVSAIIAGWRASLPLGYVTDDIKVPLITGIPSSDEYYSSDDLDALAKSGWYMLTQVGSGPVSCYMQKTTAYDSAEKSEESFIVALDMAMRDIRETLTQYTKGGLRNRISRNVDAPVTKAYLATLNAAIGMVRYKYLSAEVFESMDIVSALPSATSSTATDVVVKFRHYYPAREIYVTGYVE